MTWEEFLAALELRNLSQRAFALETDTSPEVVNRWQHRKRGVPRWVAFWLSQHLPKKPTAARRS